MNKVRSYDDYMCDIILESLDEYRFIISPELRRLIKSINHPISKSLSEDCYNEIPNKFTFIDVVPNENDKWSFVISSKFISDSISAYTSSTGYQYDPNKTMLYSVIDFVNRDNKIIDKIRSKIKIGRLIQKIYPNRFPLNGKPGEDIESFVKDYMSLLETDEKNTKIVKGNDIINWYEYTKYHDGSGTLQSSCMRYTQCGEYLEFYANNPDKVQMVILLDDEDKDLRSRALLWKLDKINDESTDRYFMDRIYYTQDKDLFKMINYARKNNFLYKKNQNSSSDDLIMDPSNGVLNDVKMIVSDMNYVLPSLKFPFLDTLYYYNPFDKVLTNYHFNRNYVELGATNGRTTIYWSTRYNEVLIKNSPDLVYSAYNDDYLKKEDAVEIYGDGYKPKSYVDKKDNVVKCKYNQKNYLINDCEYVDRYDDYIPRWILKDHFRYSDFYDEWLSYDDAVYSEHMGDYILSKDAIKVYINASASKYYYTLEDDPHGDFYEYDGKYYHDSISEEEIEKYKSEHESN